MTRRPTLGHAVVLIFGLAVTFAVTSASAAPKLISASSRLNHGTQSFEVALPLTGATGSGIECRDVSAGTTILLSFSEPVTSANVAVSSGKATVAAPPTFAGNSILVPLKDIANAQALTLTATNIVGPGGNAPDAMLNVRFLLGDVNADAAVNSADLSAIQNQSGTPLTGANFRTDSNVNGTVNALDVVRVRGRTPKAVAGGASTNAAPTVVRPGADVGAAVVLGRTPASIPLTVSDAESSASSLFVTASSSDKTVLPDSSLSVSGSGANRVLTITSSAGSVGQATVTVTVSDGLTTSSLPISMTLEEAAPTLFIARMMPQGGINTLASGVSTLMFGPDGTNPTYATVKFNYSNLSTPEVSKHIHGPANPGESGGILFDLDEAQPNPDGSYTWTFVPVGTNSVADIITAIKQGRTYINIHSELYPNGEIRGQYLQATGSMTFTPPAPPPPISVDGPLTDSQATRFLIQATFGPSEQDMAKLRTTGIEAWLVQQFNMPQTSHLAKLWDRIADGDNETDPSLFTEVWWNIALTGQDQLRQRVAFALSQIMVISQADGDLSGRPQTVASYYDMLARNAFGNYRTLLQDVTLHPAMGQYLDLRGSRKAEGIVIPNENYAREVLQLFSIGLYKLHPDGTLMLDQNGEPIPTYDQNVLAGIRNADGTYVQHGLAAAITGWNWHQTSTTNTNPGANYLDPMTPITSLHEDAAKVIFDGIGIPAGQGAQKDMADVLNHIFNHANTGPFICKQLIQRLVCSNPSPGYVYRVSQVFADNGQGVRGDLKAVVRAILIDYEARSATVVSNQGFGKLREPVLRTSHVLRALHVGSNSGFYRLRNTDSALGQTPMRAPTVFNFFEPGYVYPGPLAENGLVAPEFQITSETSTMNTTNFLWNGVRNANNNGTFQDGDLYVDLATERALAGNPTALVDRLDKILMAGQMSPEMKQRVITYVNGIAASDTIGRARAAVTLVVTSPEFATQK